MDPVSDARWLSRTCPSSTTSRRRGPPSSDISFGLSEEIDGYHVRQLPSKSPTADDLFWSKSSQTTSAPHSWNALPRTHPIAFLTPTDAAYADNFGAIFVAPGNARSANVNIERGSDTWWMGTPGPLSIITYLLSTMPTPRQHLPTHTSISILAAARRHLSCVRARMGPDMPRKLRRTVITSSLNDVTQSFSRRCGYAGMLAILASRAVRVLHSPASFTDTTRAIACTSSCALRTARRLDHTIRTISLVDTSSHRRF